MAVWCNFPEWTNTGRVIWHTELAPYSGALVQEHQMRNPRGWGLGVGCGLVDNKLYWVIFGGAHIGGNRMEVISGFEWKKNCLKVKATCKPFLRYYLFSVFLKRQKKKLLYLACDFLGALVYQLTNYGIHTCTSWLFCSLSLLCSLPSVLLYFILQYFQHLL